MWYSKTVCKQIFRDSWYPKRVPGGFRHTYKNRYCFLFPVKQKDSQWGQMFESQFRSTLREQSATRSADRSQAHPRAPLKEAVPPGFRQRLKSQNKQPTVRRSRLITGSQPDGWLRLLVVLCSVLVLFYLRLFPSRFLRLKIPRCLKRNLSLPYYLRSLWWHLNEQ